jgi:PAS domain S-box-containing protein
MAMVLTDPSLHGNPIIFANQAFLDLTGYPMEEVLGQQPHFLNGPNTDPEDAERFRQILADDRDGVVETVQYAKNGRRFVATVLLSAFKDPAGTTLHHFLSWADVTRRVDAEVEAADLRAAQAALRKSEARYRLLFDTIDEGFCIIEMLFDDQGRATDYVFLETNPVFEQQAGFSITTGQRMREIAPEHEQFWFDAYGRVARTGEPARFEHRADTFGLTYDVYAFRVDEAAQHRVAVLFRDVTQRKGHEAAMRESQARLSAAFESVPAGIAVIGNDAKVLLANAEFDRFMPTGLMPSRDPERISRWQAWDQDGRLIAPAYYPGTRALRGERVIPGQEMLYTDDEGRSVWTSVAAAPTFDAMGTVNGCVSVISDITERKGVEAALRKSEAHLATELKRTTLLRDLAAQTVNELSDPAICDQVLSTAIALTDADAGTVQTYDPKTSTLTLHVMKGIPPAMADHFQRVDAASTTACGIALRTGQRTFVDYDKNDDRASAVHVAAGYRSTQATLLFGRDGSPIGMINTHWRASGYRPSEDQLRFLDLLARQAADLMEQRRDAEALRESEERLRQFGEASQDVLWIRDAGTLQWTYLTPAFETIYGLSREEALAGDDYCSWLELILPEDRQHARDSLERVRAGEHMTFEFRIRRANDGAIRWLRNTDFPITDERGQVTLLGGIGHDITDHRESEERQKVLLAELQHRVRNILAVIRSIVSRSDDGERSAEEYVQHLQGRITALARTQVLLTRRAGAVVDLEDMIRDELVGQAAKDEQFTLAGPDIELSPKAAEVLTLAIHELATNATKYGAFARQGGSLRIEWRIEAREGQNWLVLRWIESGVPIVDAVPRRQGFGSELISRRIPYELRGTGTFELKPGGLESRIEFPLRPGDSILQTGGVD